MIIKPPNDQGITLELMIEKDEIVEFTEEQYELINNRIKNYLKVAPWTCPNCRLTNFGRNLKCADWRCRMKKP